MEREKSYCIFRLDATVPGDGSTEGRGFPLTRVVNHVQADGGVSHDTNEMVKLLKNKNIDVECPAKGPGELRIASSRLSFISVVANVYSMAIYLIV